MVAVLPVCAGVDGLSVAAVLLDLAADLGLGGDALPIQSKFSLLAHAVKALASFAGVVC